MVETDVESQRIKVQDTTDPVLIDVPADITVECSAVPEPESPTADDNCDLTVEITYDEVRTDGSCAFNYTLTRTWTATDNCGNVDVEVQKVTVKDLTPPELSCPADLVIECGESTEPSNTAVAPISSLTTPQGVVDVFGFNPQDPLVNHAGVISTNPPPAADLDLGSPNEAFLGGLVKEWAADPVYTKMISILEMS